MLKFSVFSDIHHVPDAFISNAPEKLEYIQKRAEKEKCEFIIHAGDLCHGASTVEDFVNKYNNFHIKSYNCLGNHDTDNTSYKDTLKYYKMDNDYYFFDNNGFRIIVLNPNYYEQDGEYINYSLGNYYSTTGSVGYVPPVQLKWLEKVIDETENSCVLISHQSFDRDADGTQNAIEVREIIDNANKKRKHSVIMCINGHYHRDYISILNNVVYFDLNSCSYDWINNPHNFYPKELQEQYKVINNTININEAIHAVITLENNGHIKIDGMEGSYFMGVSTQMTDNPLCDESGRAFTPRVSSLDIKLC